jgi:hypothetical protein
MQSSLSWIEWLDRLDRVLNGAREDVRALASFDDPQALAVVERCKRQLTALTDDLRLLDRRVLSAKPGATTIDSALRDSCYEAAMLLGPVRLRA